MISRVPPTASCLTDPVRCGSLFLTSQPGILDEINGPFDASQMAGYWGKQPLLIRDAFDEDEAWPCWDDIFDLACYNDKDDDKMLEPGESARLIQHVSNQLDSFTLELGPFAANDLADIVSSSTINEEQKKWTLVVNDVDRYMPELSMWVDQKFDFLPRWRIDDAQVSIAGNGGGIGPHVDNYDVFLIQTSGQRTWLVDADHRLSISEERDLLVPDIDVSVLDMNKVTPGRTAKLTLNKGDCLYLPPRVVHWGTAVNNCMTLSVGCRAPSASDLVARVAETVQMSMADSAVQRYTDNENLLTGSTACQYTSLDHTAKESMKNLVRKAIENVLDNELEWDDLVGRITTEAIRYSEDCVCPFSEEDQVYRNEWGETPEAVLLRVVSLGKTAAMIRAPGISCATSQLSTDRGTVNRLYVNGERWQVWNDSNAVSIFRAIELGETIHGEALNAVNKAAPLFQTLVRLVSDGILRASERK